MFIMKIIAETEPTSVRNRANAVLSPALVRQSDLLISRAEGPYLWTEDGRRVLDFVSGIAVTNVGHGNPKVLKAAHEQMDRLLHVCHNVAMYDSYLQLAEELANRVAMRSSSERKVFFSNSGAEAVEGAVKLALQATGRSAVISFKRAFHGRTLAATGVSASSATYRSGYMSAFPVVHHLDFPAPFLSGLDEEDEVIRCLAQIDELFALIVRPAEVAAILVEPVQGEGGYYPAPTSFLKGLKERADQHGIVLIFDEIQTGFGRTGKLFAFEHSGVVPDVITLAKGIANGFPLSAIVARKELMDQWLPGSHGTTFGGNPVSCAASLAVLEILDGGAIDNAAAVGGYLQDRLLDLVTSLPYRTDVRGVGLMIGVEFRHDDGSPATEYVSRVRAAALDQGLLLLGCGTQGNIIRLMPPTTLTEEQADEGLKILETALVSMATVGTE